MKFVEKNVFATENFNVQRFLYVSLIWNKIDVKFSTCFISFLKLLLISWLKTIKFATYQQIIKITINLLIIKVRIEIILEKKN